VSAERRPVKAQLHGTLFETLVGELEVVEIAGRERVIAYPAGSGVGVLLQDEETARAWLVRKAEEKGRAA
jgi:hypothetical protein